MVARKEDKGRRKEGVGSKKEKEDVFWGGLEIHGNAVFRERKVAQKNIKKSKGSGLFVRRAGCEEVEGQFFIVLV